MSDDVAVNLIRALVENSMRLGDEWQSFAQVISFDGDALLSVSGYAYGPDSNDDITAIATRPADVEDAVRAYCSSLYEPGAPMPKQMLVQFNRDSKQFEVDFEHNDPDRWTPSPANIATIRQELRPPF